MERLSLDSNSFSGTIDMTRLPGSMRTLDLGRNNFVGSTDFGKLPKSLRFLYVNDTRLVGEIQQNQNNGIFAEDTAVTVLPYEG
eukprot:CAMPEP_0201522196 /NCGR_PEP_ID=MMETSP0161_2-20130828/16512_1 /ASSEMBLY_ACC=CAM_ASM_000251 /TAXON_ID=180227 /ORGANISM="Neoparamoeba aestuarina, Strain SoJaBio B1-5/56/2" /LENGTH=83 /DNA_ID=CAMNT_0047920971 /DNA_START=209 /DNA_END=460 /DNA_ORIENTATION=+